MIVKAYQELPRQSGFFSRNNKRMGDVLPQNQTPNSPKVHPFEQGEFCPSGTLMLIYFIDSLAEDIGESYTQNTVEAKL
jgi:hypothetical protein